MASDEFERKKNARELPLVWQWNHNPVDSLFSLKDRKGHLRLTTGGLVSSFVQAKNTLTQRTIGPVCNGSTALDISNMKEGDFAGLSLLQRYYGLVGIKFEGGKKKIVMVHINDDKPQEEASIPVSQKKVYLKASCDFREKKDEAKFYYSLDGKKWNSIGTTLKMSYTLPHFMGYRFGLFNFASQETGGFVDFDYFRIKDKLD